MQIGPNALVLQNTGVSSLTLLGLEFGGETNRVLVTHPEKNRFSPGKFDRNLCQLEDRIARCVPTRNLVLISHLHHYPWGSVWYRPPIFWIFFDTPPRPPNFAKTGIFFPLLWCHVKPVFPIPSDCHLGFSSWTFIPHPFRVFLAI